MKQILLIPVLLCSQGAFAATRCVPYSEDMLCIGDEVPAHTLDAITTCTAGNVTFTVHMMGVCASDQAEHGATADTIHISDDPSENTRCWCRMLSPAVSKWVVTESKCNNGDCASRCRLYGEGHSKFRKSLFNSLI